MTDASFFGTGARTDAIPTQYRRVADLLEKVNPDDLSPRDALEMLYKLKEASREN